MDKTLRKKIWQIWNIVMWWKTRLFLKLVKNNLSDNFQHKYYNKEEKVDLLKKWKYKNIKYSLNSIKGSNDNREIIGEEYFEIENFYNKYWIDQKYLDNAKDFIDRVLIKKHIDNRNFSKVMQLINWDRFLVEVNKDIEWNSCYIHMEIKNVDNELIDKVKKVNDDIDINIDKIIVRHINDGVDLWNMVQSLLEWKENIINKIDKYKDINFIKSCAWLWDRNFINWWKQKREWKSSKIIDYFDQEQNYSYYLLENQRETDFWRKRIKEWSSLIDTIEEYENDVCPLAEWELLIDLDKMKELLVKAKNQNPEE